MWWWWWRCINHDYFLLVSNGQYKAFLERIVENDMGYEEFGDILNRHNTLTEANNDLMRHSAEVMMMMMLVMLIMMMIMIMVMMMVMLILMTIIVMTMITVIMIMVIMFYKIIIHNFIKVGTWSWLIPKLIMLMIWGTNYDDKNCGDVYDSMRCLW